MLKYWNQIKFKLIKKITNYGTNYFQIKNLFIGVNLKMPLMITF